MPKEQPHFDIGIVVPLREEYRYVVEVAPQLESISHEGTYFYRLDLGAFRAVCCVVDQMGTLPAAQATTRLIHFAKPKLIVLLGVAGALDDDLALGDVAIGAEVNEFQANAKADSDGDAYTVRYSGRHWPLDYGVREALSHFEFSNPDAFLHWQNLTRAHRADLATSGDPSTVHASTAHLGPIASGNIVAAARAFVAELKRVDRKFIAIDMEAAGVAVAATERIQPLPWLVVRGISDHANEDKKALDAQGKRAWRRFAVRNAATYLLGLLKWDGFLSAVGLDAPAPSSGDTIAIDLAAQLASYTGGRWLTGVLFGIYYYGPNVSVDACELIDISRLQAFNAPFRELLEAAEDVKANLLADRAVKTASNRLSALLGEFRQRVNLPGLDVLLHDADNVVAAILSPEDDNEKLDSILLQADKLEEEVGMEAVIPFLVEYVGRDPRLRERYVDALATMKNWSEVVETLSKVEQVQLSRLELEHGFTAFAETGRLQDAKTLLTQHEREYPDNAAKVFREHVSRRYPDIDAKAPGGEA
jgi:nucleoside phosphorylase